MIKSFFASAFLFGSVLSANAAEAYLVVIGGSTAPGSTTGAAIATLLFPTMDGCKNAAAAVKPISQVHIQTYCVPKE